MCKEILIYFQVNFFCTGPPALVTQLLMICPRHLDFSLFPNRAVFPRVLYSRLHWHSHCRLISSFSMAIYSLSMAVSCKDALFNAAIGLLLPTFTSFAQFPYHRYKIN